MDAKQIEEFAKQIAEKLSSDKLENAAKNDCKYYVENFAYNVESDPGDYEDYNDLAGDFYEGFKNDEDVMGSSDVASEIADEIYKLDEVDENDGETIDAIISKIMNIWGYECLQEYIYETGWNEEVDNIIGKLEDNLRDYFEDQELQMQDQEEMRSRSYYW